MHNIERAEKGILPWQLRLFLATTLAGGGVSAVEIAQRFSANTPTIEAHEIDCLGGVAVNDAKPGTVVEIIDPQNNKLISRITIDGSRKGSGRWPAGQKSNNETGPQSNQHNLRVLARVAGLPDTPKEVPCNNSTWNIRVPETIGTSNTPAAASTPERTVIPTAVATVSVSPSPVATERPVATATIAVPGSSAASGENSQNSSWMLALAASVGALAGAGGLFLWMRRRPRNQPADQQHLAVDIPVNLHGIGIDITLTPTVTPPQTPPQPGPGGNP